MIEPRREGPCEKFLQLVDIAHSMEDPLIDGFVGMLVVSAIPSRLPGFGCQGRGREVGVGVGGGIGRVGVMKVENCKTGRSWISSKVWATFLTYLVYTEEKLSKKIEWYKQN